MPTYAASTEVPVSKSKAEIEQILERYGASQFLSGWREGEAMIGFTIENRQIRFILPMPDRDDKRFTHHSRGRRTGDAAHKAWEQACRQRWRALALVIKAKLEAVESGISILEHEFMANIVMPDGRLVSDHVSPRIAHAYETGEMPPLLPSPAGE